MKLRTIFLMAMLASLLGVHAQKLTVEKMAAAPMDISASQYERKDLTGKPCGLVKVQLAAAGAQFEGNVIKPTEYKTGEYWVYMTEGSYMLTVKHPSFVPLDVNFRDYGITSVKGKATYKLTLLMPQAGPVNVDDGMRYLVMTVEPANATVYVDGQPQVLQNGSLSVLLPMGQHSYRVESPAYETKSGTFTIGDEKLSLPVKLESNMATLNVSTTTQGTQIYVNDQLRGTSSWSGTLLAGTYRIEGRLQGYRNHRQNITLAQRDRQQLTIPALQAIVGNLNVNYQPTNAEVWLDGKKMGTSPDIFRNIQVGSHEVELRASGHQPKKETVTIEEGKTAQLAGSLTKMPTEDAEIEGKTPAQIRSLGYDYREGTGGKSKDYAKAMKYFRIAAERGNTSAMVDIGFMYENAQGVVQDYAEAVKWYRKAAEQGNAWGQHNLGYMYRKGRGVVQDYAEAVKWYRKAAEQGNASGQCNLGYMYEMGYGVVQDYAEAVKWYRKAAEQGHSIAQYNLGVCYRQGKGVEQDLSQAKYWYEKAAAQGHEDAKKRLSEMSAQ